MELRDAITLVFAPASQFDSVLPADASEALVSYNRETGEIKREGPAKSTDAPNFKLMM